jgi:hypothetical protein
LLLGAAISGCRGVGSPTEPAPLRITFDGELLLSEEQLGDLKGAAPHSVGDVRWSALRGLEPELRQVVGVCLLAVAQRFETGRWPSGKGDLAAFATEQRIPLDIDRFEKLEFRETPSGREAEATVGLRTDGPGSGALEATLRLTGIGPARSGQPAAVRRTRILRGLRREFRQQPAEQ